MNQKLHSLFVLELQDLYSGEQQIIEALPKMIQITTDPTLKEAFETHLEETKEQEAMLKKLCEEMEIDPEGRHCLGMEGIITEGDSLQMDFSSSLEMDLGLVAAAQKVEHYEIAGYGTAANLAQEMGHAKAQKLLHQILEEEKSTDKKLSTISEDILKRLSQLSSPQKDLEV